MRSRRGSNPIERACEWTTASSTAVASVCTDEHKCVPVRAKASLHGYKRAELQVRRKKRT
eukprot:6175435-Pleurochrysis_carterae.AAC.2